MTGHQIERRGDPAPYRAFLLRLWPTAGGVSVRASVADVATGETHAFPDLDGLHRWLAAAGRPGNDPVHE